ncbi:hypothetical protein RZF22_001440 [Citrobacter freundii]|nr:hypothetical protein [Citrobacter freundii]
MTNSPNSNRPAFFAAADRLNEGTENHADD